MQPSKSTTMIRPLHFGYAESKTISHASCLKSLINQLLRHELSETMRSSDSSVKNEISPDIFIVSDVNKIVPVFQELLATIINNSRKGRIHIRAERFRDIIILEVEDQSNYNGYALDYSLRSIEPVARRVGGTISIKGQQQLETSVSFSFPDRPETTGYDC
jgi:hypothetical protein